MKINDIDKWRTELQLSEEFRRTEFGEYSRDRITKAGENLEYFEKGFTFGHFDDEVDTFTTLNLFHAISKNIVPALYYQNPKINTIPQKKEDEESAPVVREIVNHYFRETDADTVNRQVIWDAYILGYGIYKLGYATKFGMDVVDEKETKKRRERSLLEKVGLRKPMEEEVTYPELDQKIISESPYVQYISPFDFLVDPRARNLDEAQWWCHVTRKTVAQVKANKKYKNTSRLVGLYTPNVPTQNNKIPESIIDDFKIVELYEIHYRSESDKYLLVISKDEGNVYREHYHEENPYEIDGWQCDMLTFNKHGHKLYPISDLSKIKNFQDRFTSTMDAVLEQIDKYVPKLIVDETGLSDDGKRTIQEGGIGAIVWALKNPSEVVKETGFTQLKADLLSVFDRIIDMVTIQTGLTKAKLLGISVAETATGEQISQGGETLRLMDMTSEVEKFINRQATKLWQVIKQFAPVEDLNLITGEAGVDPRTGAMKYNWLPDIDSTMSERLSLGQYRFSMAVGSTQRHDMASIRKQFENLFNIVANSQAVMTAQQQGKKIDIGEFLKMYLAQYPEIIKDVGKIIQDIGPQTQGLIPPEGMEGGGDGTNALRALQAQPGASMPQVMSEAGQI